MADYDYYLLSVNLCLIFLTDQLHAWHVALRST